MRITLGVNRPLAFRKECDAIALSLSEPVNPANPSWQLDVYASTVGGRVYVGTINTVAAVNGYVPARVVGYASCPGARAWFVEAIGPTPAQAGNTQALADLLCHPVQAEAYGLSPGVTRVQGRTILNGVVATTVGGDSTAPLASSRIDFTAPIVFSGAFGSNESAGVVWLMFFDAAAIPANGTQPVHGYAIDVPAGGTFNFVTPGNGTFMRNGMCWAASGTPATLTTEVASMRVTTIASW